MKAPALAAALALAAGCGGGSSTDDSDTDSGSSGSADGETGDASSGVAGCDEPFELQCPAAVEAECAGPTTPASVPPPEPACPDWTVDGQAPAEFPPGVTEVEFSLAGAGMTDSCTTTVTIVDTLAPQIECPAPEIFVRGSEGELVSAPGATATDTCDAAPTVTADSPELPPGTTAVTYTATDAAGNTAMCSVNLGVIDAFAVPGYRILSASLVDDETEVTLAWEPPLGAHIDELRVETADAEDGPWQTVQTLPTTEQLYTFTLPSETAWYRVVSVAEEGDGGATEPRQAFRITPDVYRIDDASVPGVNFLTTIYGAVRYPTELGEGPYPLVLMLHGNHGNCRDNPDDDYDYCVTTNTLDCPGGAYPTPNAEGYVYLLETLAAQGFVAVSISANALNCRDDFIIERAQLVGEHLRRWDAWNTDDTGPFGGTFVGALDLSRVGLMGHSRGGDAISHVHEVLEQDPIPGLTLRSLFAVAPTDYHNAAIPESEFITLLPSCDGDVITHHGQFHYDRSTAFDDGAHRAQVFYIGGIHNFFNTEWRLSEWELFGNDPNCEPPPDPLKQEQTALLEGVLGSWFWTGLMNEDEPEPFIRADAPSPTAFDLWAGSDLELRLSYSSPDRMLVDDFTDANAPAINALGGTNAFEDWYLFEECYSSACDPYFLHLKNVLRLLWEQGNVPLATFALQGYDASDFEMLSFRVVSRRSTLNTGLEEQDFVIRIADQGGTEVELLLSDIKPLAHLYPRNNPLEILETYRVPFPDELDTSALGTLQFEMTALDRDGSVIVSDIELAN